MPRKLRVEYPGAIYQVLSRADGRKGRIFLNDMDRLDFLATPAKAYRPEWLRALAGRWTACWSSTG